MIRNIIERWQAIKELLFAEEYFLTTANHHNPYGETRLGPIKYNYLSNTNRELFYHFVKTHIDNLNLNENDN